MIEQSPDIQRTLDSIVAQMASCRSRGKVADYIPALANISSDRFGIAVATADGRSYFAGDAHEPFSLQSISKVFALSMALGKVGESLWQRVGREPSGTAYNSIAQLELDRGIPRNPFINAGAIVVDDILLGRSAPRDTIGEIVRFARYLASDDTIVVDKLVANSERQFGFRNLALANYMKAFGALKNDVDFVLGVYFHQCALSLSCIQLASAGRYLMLEGRHPDTDLHVVSEERARRINALMLTCGHYDQSGEFAFRIGMPGKSGVGGGMLAIAPGKASIAVWSPGLNEQGNSLLGLRALEALAIEMRWSVFQSG